MAAALHAGPGAIVRSATPRAAHTAAPLATATGITPAVLPANDPQAFENEIRQCQAGRTVLLHRGESMKTKGRRT